MNKLNLYLLLSLINFPSELEAMYRKDSVVHAPGSEWIQPHVTGFLPYCSECCKKLLWRLVDRRDEVFHLDLHDLMECRNRCILCEYICDLFGQDHLEEHLARTTTNTPRLEKHTSFKTANRVVYHSGGYTDLLTLLRAPTNTPRVSIECDWRAAKASPIVTIECDTTESCPDPNGHLDHVSIRISIQNHPTGIIHDSRSFTVHTRFGMHSDSSCSHDITEVLLTSLRQSISQSHMEQCRFSRHQGKKCNSPRVASGVSRTPSLLSKVLETGYTISSAHSRYPRARS